MLEEEELSKHFKSSCDYRRHFGKRTLQKFSCSSKQKMSPDVLTSCKGNVPRCYSDSRQLYYMVGPVTSNETYQQACNHRPTGSNARHASTTHSTSGEKNFIKHYSRKLSSWFIKSHTDFIREICDWQLQLIDTTQYDIPTLVKWYIDLRTHKSDLEASIRPAVEHTKQQMQMNLNWTNAWMKQKPEFVKTVNDPVSQVFKTKYSVVDPYVLEQWMVKNLKLQHRL